MALPTATASTRIGFHPRIGRELLALADADRGGDPAQLGLEEIERLLLNHVVQLLVELEIIGVDGVERHLRALMNSIFGGLAALLSE